MMSAHPALPPPSVLAVRTALAGALVAIADLTWAVLWVREAHGASARRVLQAVASGVLGSAAFQGGWLVALLGLLVHTAVAFGWTLLFLGALVRWPTLHARVRGQRGARAVGLLYGALVWLLMDGLVLPLSRARATPPTAAWFWLQLLTHPFLVGLPIVWVLASPAATDGPRR